MSAIGRVSDILYKYDQLKEHPYGSRAIIIHEIANLGKVALRVDATGSDLAHVIMDFSEDKLLQIIEVIKKVYAIPTNRKDTSDVPDSDSDSDSIDYFG